MANKDGTAPVRYALLPERARLRLSGAGAAGFLNALLTQDVERLAAQPAVHAGLLTPKGKLSFDFLLAADGEAIVLDCDAGQRDALMAKLSLYRMRAEVDIEAQEPGVIVVWSADAEMAAALPLPSEAAVMFADPRLAALGARILPRHSTRDVLALLQESGSAHPGEVQDYRGHRLSLGIAEGAAELPAGQLFPWEANLDLLNGLSLNKGCFIGQEIVSRVYRKGKVSRRLLPLRFADAGGDVAAGAPIRLQGKHIGSLHFRRGAQGLGLVQMDALADIAAPLASPAGPVDIIAGSAPAQLLWPTWLTT